MPLVEGRQYRVSVWAAKDAAYVTGATYVAAYFLTADGVKTTNVTVMTATGAVTGQWQEFTGVFTAPPLAVGCWLYVRAVRSSGTGSFYFTVLSLSKVNGAELLVDGAITAEKIAVGAVTADSVAAGAITASKIQIGDTSNIFPDPMMVDDASYSGNVTYTFQTNSENIAGASTRLLQIPPGQTGEVWSVQIPVERGLAYYVAAIMEVLGVPSRMIT